MGRVTTPVPPTSPDPDTSPADTVPDRRTALRAGGESPWVRSPPPVPRRQRGATASASAPPVPRAPRPRLRRPAPIRTSRTRSPTVHGTTQGGAHLPRPGRPRHHPVDPRHGGEGGREGHGARGRNLARRPPGRRPAHRRRRSRPRQPHTAPPRYQHHVRVGRHAEIQGCADRLRRLTGSIGTWFRPSARPGRPTPSHVSPAASAIRTSCRTTSTPSTTPHRAHPPHPQGRRRGPQRFGGEPAPRLPGHGHRLPVLLHELDHRGISAVTATELLS